jgi:glucokinase
MEVKWLSEDFAQDRVIVACDIGGTNTNLALVGQKKGSFTILVEYVYGSQAIDGLLAPLKELLAGAVKRDKRLEPSLCCISAAGPVENNVCKMTNVSWIVDGHEIERTLRLRTAVINDFLAISYGIPTLDVDDPKQILKIPHSDGSVPPTAPGPKAVLGPGTGLGVSYIAYHDGAYIPCPSEGGHALFAPFDEETEQLAKYVTRKLGETPGVEPFVSGQGIDNVYEYFRDVKGLAVGGVFEKIEGAAPAERPGLIANQASSNPVCKQMMQLFVRMLARFSGSVTATFMPVGGLYLAGGTVIKNQDLLVEGNLFMSGFERSYKPHIVALAKKTPVYVIRDYAISLYGAANAAVNLLK